MATRDIVTLGASAGGIDTIQRLVSKLPHDFPAAIMIVQHLHPRTPSVLDQIIQRATTLSVRFATDGEPVTRGHIRIAPPNCHLLVEKGYLRVLRGPRENRHRPAVDPLFRSAAWSYGPRVVGVILSGTLDDGVSGLWAVRSCGGTTVVQDPEEAAESGMPRSALLALNVDHVATIDGIAALLNELARKEFDPGPVQRPPQLGLEMAIAEGADLDVEGMQKLGRPSGFSCPACHGGLWELTEGELEVYRCHIGHTFGPETLQEAQAREVEFALESALRALEEQSAAARRLSDRMELTIPTLALRYEKQAGNLEEQAAVIRKLLRNGQVKTTD
jgi:two-component system, chemotaxis family, protein-glutamate methylesterase/glutaminase